LIFCLTGVFGLRVSVPTALNAGEPLTVTWTRDNFLDPLTWTLILQGSASGAESPSQDVNSGGKQTGTIQFDAPDAGCVPFIREEREK
jgi:hypothetical protein